MMSDPFRTDSARDEAARSRVLNANTDDFATLIKLSGLDPARQLRFGDWSGISFRGSDLRGFNFTGARLLSCDFTDALIEGARFDQAEIDRIDRPVHRHETNLRAAADWRYYHDRWKGIPSPLPDDHLPLGAVFYDAPCAPEMVVASLARSSNDSVARSFAVSRRPVSYEQFLTGTRYTDRKLHYDKRGHSLGRLNSEPPVVATPDAAIAYIECLVNTTAQPYRLLSRAEYDACISQWPPLLREVSTILGIFSDGFDEIAGSPLRMFHVARPLIC